jgi:signal transduction histidine kinase
MILVARARGLRPVVGEVVPLRERVVYMEALRAVIGGLVVLATVLGVARGAGPWPLAVITAAYLGLSLLPLVLRRAEPTRLLPLYRGMLLVDGIYLAWVLLQSGGPFSPLRSLLFVHVIVVTLLVSYRTGLKDTAWLTLLFLVVAEASELGIGHPAPTPNPGDSALAVAMTIAALWAIAFATATFSAINERALRRQNAQLARLATMTEEIDGAEEATDIPAIVLDALRETFGFTRGVMIASLHDEPRVLAGTGAQPLPEVPTGLDPLMERSWLQREPTLVRRIDPAVDERLATLLPDAINVVIVPLFLPKGYRLGLIALEHGTSRGTMRRRDVLLVAQFASHAALALHNAWLMEERIAKLEEIEALQREIVAHNARLEIAVAERTEQLRETVSDLEAVDAQRRQLLQGLVRAQEDERTRLANDIHDDPLQKLVSIKMRVELLRRGGEHLDELNVIHDTLRSCIASLRFMLFDLRPPILDERGLAPALERFLDQSDLQAAWSVHDDLSSAIDSDMRVILYRIAQEALVNVRKHADATHVSVRLMEDDAGISMRISDDGRGFLLADDSGSRPGHLGLGSMRERAEMAGGTCSLFSLPGTGTTLEVWLPHGHPETAGAPDPEEVLYLAEKRLA